MLTFVYIHTFIHTNIHSFLLNATSEDCLDVSYDEMIAELRNISLAGVCVFRGHVFTCKHIFLTFMCMYTHRSARRGRAPVDVPDVRRVWILPDVGF
jgi:hypothetical protein